MLADSAAAAYRFAEFSPEQLETIFQSFVRNFFAHHQSIYRVSAERFRWQKTFANESALSYVPTMDNRPVDGLLLYAQADDELFLDLNMFGHDVRVATIDLASSPEAIGSRLFKCAKVEFPNQAAA